ncbi:MAG: hypothetical protein ABJH05_17115 [Fulvivirga sp.]
MQKSIPSFTLYVYSIDELKENIESLFHSDYFFLQNRIVIFFNNANKSLQSSINLLLYSHGYVNPLIIPFEENFGVTCYHTGNGILHEIEESQVLIHAIKKNTLLIFSNDSLYNRLLDCLENYSNSAPLNKMLLHLVYDLERENLQLKEQLSWHKNKIKNYQTYLEILKKLIRENSGLALNFPNNTLTRLLKRSNLLRKYGKKIYLTFFK